MIVPLDQLDGELRGFCEQAALEMTNVRGSCPQVIVAQVEEDLYEQLSGFLERLELDDVCTRVLDLDLQASVDAASAL